MNTWQQIFVVFFAIFWGTAANAWPKWKPFHWPCVPGSWRVAGRVLWSFLALNVAPVVFVGCTLKELERQHSITGSLVPAFAIFGIYRIWVGVIELRPDAFYYTAAKQVGNKAYLAGVDPTIEDLKLSGRRWWANILFGAVYVAVAWCVARS